MKRFSNVFHIGQANRAGILSLILAKTCLSRTQLIEKTGLTGASVSRIIRELMDAGLVKEGARITPKGRIGRREIALEMDPSGPLLFAITLAANRKTVSIANLLGDSLCTSSLDHLDYDDPGRALQCIAAVAKKLIQNNGYEERQFLGAAIVLATETLSPDERHYSSEAIGWRDVPIREIMESLLAVPVIIEDRPAALMRSHISVSQMPPDKTAYLINVGLGIGGCVYLNAGIWSGVKRQIGPLAHMRHPAATNLCACGKTGCLDTVASGYAVLQQITSMRRSKKKHVNPSGILADAINDAEQGCPVADNAFYNAGFHLADAVDAIVALFNAETIILAGEVGRQKDYVRGVESGLVSLGRTDASKVLSISRITSNQAAIQFGLEGLLLDRNTLDRIRLNSQQPSAKVSPPWPLQNKI